VVPSLQKKTGAVAGETDMEEVKENGVAPDRETSKPKTNPRTNVGKAKRRLTDEKRETQPVKKKAKKATKLQNRSRRSQRVST